jgi:hypothetical protein
LVDSGYRAAVLSACNRIALAGLIVNKDPNEVRFGLAKARLFAQIVQFRLLARSEALRSESRRARGGALQSTGSSWGLRRLPKQAEFTLLAPCSRLTGGDANLSNQLRQIIGLDLERVVRLRDLKPSARWELAEALLNRVGQFVGQELPALGAIGNVFAFTENHVIANRVRQSVHGRRRFRCLEIRMHPNMAEVTAEARFKKVPAGQIQGPAWRTQDLVDDGRRLTELRRPQGLVLNRSLFLRFFGSRRFAAGGFALRRDRDAHLGE